MIDKELFGLLLGPAGLLVFSLIINYIQFKKNERLEALLSKMLEDGTIAETALAFTIKPIAKAIERQERSRKRHERLLRRIERYLGMVDDDSQDDDDSSDSVPVVRRGVRDLLADDS